VKLKSALAGKLNRRTIYLPLFIFSLISYLFFVSHVDAQDQSGLPGDSYYLQLKKDEFLQTMISKEKCLLQIVQNVQQELNDRKKEGVTIADLGIEEVVSPDEIVLEEYANEFVEIVRLLDEIELLERRAKKKVNLEILEALSRLKNQIYRLIEGEKRSAEGSGTSEKSNAPVNADSQSLGTGSIENSITTAFSQDAVAGELFEQWKYNRILDYQVKLTRYKLLRKKLLQTANPIQEERMFRRDLKKALENYSAGDLSVASLQFSDILGTYTQYTLFDDVLYYASEASFGLNYLDDAIEGYKRVIAMYKDSPFAVKSVVKLIFIYYIYGEYDIVTTLYKQLVPRKAYLDGETFSTVSYLVGHAQFNAGRYGLALNSLGNVIPGTTYFYPSLYLSAACYSNLGQDTLAISQYYRLIEEDTNGGRDHVLAQIQSNALLKLGLIHYERGDNEKAVSYFNRVSSDFQYYDLSILGKAWSAYRSGRPGVALQNIETLMQQSVVSNYAYEAQVLAASSKQLLGKTEEAIEDLKQVYSRGNRAERVNVNAQERMRSLQNVEQVEAAQRDFMDDRDHEIFLEVEQIRQFLQMTTFRSRESGSGKDAKNEDFTDALQVLDKKIEALDRLEEQAREQGNTPFLSQIRNLRSALIQTRQDQSSRRGFSLLEPEEDPFIRRIGMAEYLKYTFRSLLMQTLREKEQTKQSMNEADKLIQEANAQNTFEVALQMEIKKEELNDCYGRLNQYEVWLREHFPRSDRVDIDQWASFSGYGISNINFSRIKETETHIARVSRTIESLDRVFSAKRNNLQNRIQGLLSDVATIEQRMQREAERRDEKEKDKFFKTGYFDRQRKEAAAGELQETPVKKEKTKK
jgi:tetratricopeptide (TPR) repeat protein